MKAIVRKQDGRKLGTATLRKIFAELVGGTPDEQRKLPRLYVAWNAFRAGVELVQRGRITRGDVIMFRLHVQPQPGRLHPLSMPLPAHLMPLPPLPPGFDFWMYRGLAYRRETAYLWTSYDETTDTDWDPVGFLNSDGDENTHYLEAVISHHRVCGCEECDALRALRDARAAIREGRAFQ